MLARSTILGNARASKHGTGDGYRSPRFFVIVIHQEYHHADAGRSIGILLF